MDAYKAHGYRNREDYLKALAEEHDIDLTTIKIMADIDGPSEDFDGLLYEIQTWKELEEM